MVIVDMILCGQGLSSHLYNQPASQPASQSVSPGRVSVDRDKKEGHLFQRLHDSRSHRRRIGDLGE